MEVPCRLTSQNPSGGGLDDAQTTSSKFPHCSNTTEIVSACIGWGFRGSTTVVIAPPSSSDSSSTGGRLAWSSSNASNRPKFDASDVSSPTGS